MIFKFDSEIATQLAHECMDNGKPKDAQKLLKKLLKKNPKYGPGLYAMSKCLISQTKYDESEIYIKNLEADYPDSNEVIELRKLIPQFRFFNYKKINKNSVKLDQYDKM